MNKNEIVLFETADNEVSLQVQMQDVNGKIRMYKKGKIKMYSFS